MKSLTINAIFIWFLFSISITTIYAQPSWETLNATTFGWRFEDMQFVTTEIGWVVDGGGQILKTTNGGVSWTQQYYNSDRYFRSVEFFNESIGFAGTLANGNPSATLLKTTDGGQSWTDISNNLPVSVPGICGMHMLDENTIFITGVFFGSAYIMKSDNQGETWSYNSMGNLCNGLVDIFFKDENIGFAVGQSAQGSGLKARIIGTTNGGVSWNTLTTADYTNQRAWKIQMLNQNVFYVSIEEFEPSPQYFKSTDGGQTWQLNEVVTTNTSGTMQGIGFLSEDLGWVGGFSELFYETIDAGATWEYQPTIGSSFNRFQRVNDTLMYTSGINVYKYVDPSLLSIEEFDNPKPKGHSIVIKNSNIITGQATIQLNLVNNTYCELSIYSALGQRVQTLVQKKLIAGDHEITWNTESIAKANYFVVLYTYHGYESIKVVLK